MAAETAISTAGKMAPATGLRSAALRGSLLVGPRVTRWVATMDSRSVALKVCLKVALMG